VLGAGVFGIVRALSIEFFKMILLAICIALPLSYLISNYWLNSFAYKVGLQWWYFAGAGLITIIITLFTISFQSIRAALANPVKALKAE
jgi:putative ABC transport system permease protein